MYNNVLHVGGDVEHTSNGLVDIENFASKYQSHMFSHVLIGDALNPIIIS